MKQAFIFLLMARSVQFFIDDKGSKRYLKGFIGIITCVIIMQSLMGTEWSSQNLRNDFSRILDQVSEMEPEIVMPEEIQQQSESEKIETPDITIQPVTVSTITISESTESENTEYKKDDGGEAEAE